MPARSTIGITVLVWIMCVMVFLGIASAIYTLVQWANHLKVPA